MMDELKPTTAVGVGHLAPGVKDKIMRARGEMYAELCPNRRKMFEDAAEEQSGQNAEMLAGNRAHCVADLHVSRERLAKERRERGITVD